MSSPSPISIFRRRKFLEGALCLLPVGQSKTKREEIKECGNGEHLWNSGSNLWALKAANFEEPGYYPPSAFVQLEACSRCGLIRLSPP